MSGTSEHTDLTNTKYYIAINKRMNIKCVIILTYKLNLFSPTLANNLSTPYVKVNIK